MPIGHARQALYPASFMKEPNEQASQQEEVIFLDRKSAKKKTRRQRAASKSKRQMATMGIVVGGLRADSLSKGEADTEESREDTITEEEKVGKLITLRKWRLAQFNMADARKGGGVKWEGLSQFMEEHKLHGIALHLHVTGDGWMLRMRAV